MNEILRIYIIGASIIGFIYALGITYYQADTNPQVKAILANSDKKLFGYFKNGLILLAVQLIATAITAVLLPLVILTDYLAYRKRGLGNG